MTICLALAIGASVLAENADAMPPARLAAEQEITLLISIVENSGATFLRNGSKHDAQQGADHLRLKLRRGAKYAKTTEDFITNLATKSSWSGKPYEVTFPDGTRHPLSEWLRAELARLRTAGK